MRLKHLIRFQVAFDQIRYALSVDHHIKIFTDDGMLIPHLHLKELEAVLPETEFVRVNRGALIPLRRVLSLIKRTFLSRMPFFSFREKFKKRLNEKIITLVYREP